MIRRAAYTRRLVRKTVQVPASPSHRAYSYVRPASVARVKSTLIQNKGLPGHGPKVLPTPRQGLLTMWGYSTSKSPNARRRALMNAIEKGGQTPVSVLRRLRLIETLTQRSQKKASNMYHNDRLWLRNKVLTA